MHTDLKKTLAAVDRCLPTEGEPTWEQLHCMYDLTLRLMIRVLDFDKLQQIGDIS